MRLAYAWRWAQRLAWVIRMPEADSLGATR
jgi:hypothetical protein